jgi:hypothetical protein
MSIALDQPEKQIHHNFIKASYILFIAAGLEIIKILILVFIYSANVYLYFPLIPVVLFYCGLAYLARIQKNWVMHILVLLVIIDIVSPLFGNMFGMPKDVQFISLSNIILFMQLALKIASIILIYKVKAIKNIETKTYKAALIIFNVFFGLLAIPVILTAPWLLMMFNSPGSENNPITLSCFYSAISFPILIIILIIVTWVMYATKNYKMALFASLSPFIGLLWFIISELALEVINHGQFNGG